MMIGHIFLLLLTGIAFIMATKYDPSGYLLDQSLCNTDSGFSYNWKSMRPMSE